MHSLLLCQNTSAQVVDWSGTESRLVVWLCACKNGSKKMAVDALPSYTLFSPTFVLAFIHRVLRFLTEVNRPVVHSIHSTYKDHNKINVHKLLKGTV